MANTFLISDTHFGHRNIVKWRNELGMSWKDIHHMNEEMIDNWNSVVRPKDFVWHLGDFCMNREFIHVASRLNGRKKLVMGNHEHFKASEYLEHFEDVAGVREFDKTVIFSHIPLHESQKRRWPKANVHGHLHNHTLDDPWYVNVCVEQINYTPIPYEELKKKFNNE